jgi:hypothetical protein
MSEDKSSEITVGIAPPNRESATDADGRIIDHQAYLEQSVEGFFTKREES